MNEKIHQALAGAGNDNQEATRRRFPRRGRDTCVVAIAEKSYPVKDWSPCGVLFEADGRLFQNNTPLDICMKFRLTGDVEEVNIHARVVRSNNRQVALEFPEITSKMQTQFNKVIDDALARDVIATQLA